MKAKLRGKIESMESEPSGNWVAIHVHVEGAVEDKLATGKECQASFRLLVKPRIAETLRFGQVLTLDVSTVEENLS